MRVQQRDIVELSYELPSGKLKVHPALVISNADVLEVENIFYAVMISSNAMNEGFNFELENAMLIKPFFKKSYVKCQLIQSYTIDEVISRISTLKQEPFERVLKKISDTVFLISVLLTNRYKQFIAQVFPTIKNVCFGYAQLVNS